jgi:carbon-monoxide dehydrogenase small subunit
MPKTISFTLNGKPAQVTTDGERELLWILRYDLGLTGTRYGCGVGQCGACTVLVDGEAARSCKTELQAVAGKSVTTIEGLARGDQLHPLQQAFLEQHAFQCGFCTSGMILAGCSLLREKPQPTREEIVAALDGNLCRCGAHPRILAAVEQAAKGGAR